MVRPPTVDQSSCPFVLLHRLWPQLAGASGRQFGEVDRSVSFGRHAGPRPGREGGVHAVQHVLATHRLKGSAHVLQARAGVQAAPPGETLASLLLHVVPHEARADVVDVVGDDVVAAGWVEGEGVVEAHPVRVDGLGHQLAHRVQFVCNTHETGLYKKEELGQDFDPSLMSHLASVDVKQNGPRF